MTERPPAAPCTARQSARRMCAHCKEMTDTPIPVGAVHQNSRPGWTVYACPEDASLFLDRAGLWAALMDHALTCEPCRRTAQGPGCAVARTLHDSHRGAPEAGR
ncbi:hypothetical protein SAMN05421773_11923 [Streptomyces aidingensis]|uniref:Uncharacterized protein n=2 Tax=Streptomyces aidingensis TaxID=910347 RepID=A0A1I1TAV2_9ACTN|nr:hypothetical protein SAMN05421773_11923 [Streptomyces aidingensis]